MKILVTGGTGFTGGHLVSRLIQQGHTVRVLARKTSNVKPLERINVELVYGDIIDKNAVKEAIKGIDYVYNIAALFRKAGVPDRMYREVNVEGTRNILDVSREEGVKRIVHCSTIGVLGHIGDPPADEKTAYNPGDIYQETKCEAEKLALSYHQKYKVPVVVARPAAIYGPGDTRMLKLFRLIAKRRFVMIGKGRVYLHLVYIDDLVTGLELCMQKGTLGQVYIIGGNEYVSLNELSKLIAEELNVSIPKIHLPAWPFKILGSLCEVLCKPFGIEPPIYRRRVDFFTKNRAFDISRAKEELGYQPKFDLKTGIHHTCQWYKQHGYI